MAALKVEIEIVRNKFGHAFFRHVIEQTVIIHQGMLIGLPFIFNLTLGNELLCWSGSGSPQQKKYDDQSF